MVTLVANPAFLESLLDVPLLPLGSISILSVVERPGSGSELSIGPVREASHQESAFLHILSEDASEGSSVNLANSIVIERQRGAAFNNEDVSEIII